MFANSSFALGAGDIAIVGFNTDGDDDFAFMLLSDITASTSINFTDNGWTGSEFNSNEGTVTWTAGSYLEAGTIITVNNPDGGSSPPISTSTGLISRSGSFNLSGSGDQIFAFEGTADFIYGMTTNGTGWDSNASSTNRSALPSSLTLGTTAIAHGISGAVDPDNGVFDFANAAPSVATASNWLNAISNRQNWLYGDNEALVMPSGSFEISTVPSPAAGLGTLSLIGITLLRRRRCIA